MRDVHDTSVPTLTFHCGARLLFHRVKFVLGLGRYLRRSHEFPLFRIFPLKAGALSAPRVLREIGLHKLVQFGNVFFSSLTVPHNPSPAFDRMLARGGLNVGAAGTPLRQQIDTVYLAITRRCELHCKHCYERHNIGAANDIPVARLHQVVAQVQQQGVSTLVLTGGEPMNRFDDLLALVDFADKHLSDIHVHTSGHGVTVERAAKLARAGLTAAAVGLDDVDPIRHDELRRFRGSHEAAVRALKIFRASGILTYVNVCATPALVRSGDLWRYGEFVRQLGVAFIQLLEPRPCGGYLQASDDVLLTNDDRAVLLEFFQRLNSDPRYRHYPVVHYVAYAESPAKCGCMMGGLAHLYIDSSGNVNPCVFVPVTFGNIIDHDFATIYDRMRRAIPRPLHKECPSLCLQGPLREYARAQGELPVPHRAVAQQWDAMFGDT